MTASPDPLPASLPRLHLVTDDRILRREGFLAAAERVMEAGGSRVALHLRGHGLGGAELWRLAERCAAAAHGFGAWLLVNDRVDVALACAANGVQLGKYSMRPGDARRLLGSDAVVGASVHDVHEASEAIADGADFLLAGTLFSSPSHPDGYASGVEWLPDLVARGTPVVGIGGIRPDRVEAVLSTGVYGVATIRAVWDAADPAAAVESFLASMGE